MKTQKVQVIPGLNSVGLIESAYRLEFHNEPSIDNQVGPDVANVLTAVKDRDDTFRFVRDLTITKGHLERTMVHGLGVSRTE
jgi:hypothetical protein